MVDLTAKESVELTLFNGISQFVFSHILEPGLALITETITIIQCLAEALREEPLGSGLNFGNDNVRSMMETGRQRAREVLGLTQKIELV